ncbi:MAG: gluconate 2-dehydrogenase subunit 3 family protein [Cyclobacteriaceae bacterium]|nr:twin-arginine translocation pathway signal [Cytophagales bacterium]HNP77108.1 gluconate 2-dehydrogenase subunit 3 family protein [Cyclobacteriaceae bacterium]
MDRRQALQRAGLVLGYAISAPVIAGIMNGCKSTPELTYKPVFFTEEQAGLVSEVAAIIIPKTDTPGAKEVGVPAFIDQLIKQCYKKEDQDRFLAGLAEFDEGAKKAYGDAFMDLDPAKQKEYVKKTHDAALDAAKAGTVKDKPFILVAKELTVVGFYTSEEGASKILQYAPVPGAFHGCVPMAEVGKTWAT